MKSSFVAVLLSAMLTTSAMAEGFFIGSNIGFALYPDRIATDPGATSTSTSQQRTSLALDLRGGQWFDERYGWEVGYDALGNIDGSWRSVSSSATGSYKYSASALHLALLGRIPLRHGKLFGKAGLFSASTTEEVATSTGTSTSATINSAGLMIGVGYEYRFSTIGVHAGFNFYHGMKFHDFMNNKVESMSTPQFAAGVDYYF